MQSLEFLRLNADELLSSATASGEAWSALSAQTAHKSSAHDDNLKKSNIQNWNLMVDGANLLCYSALKVEQLRRAFIHEFDFLCFFL